MERRRKTAPRITESRLACISHTGRVLHRAGVQG